MKIKLVNMSYEARVIYDFDSVSSEELGVKEGDTVTVVDAGIGQGWVMARARDGREGVVPEAYLERTAEAGGDMRRSVRDAARRRMSKERNLHFTKEF